MRIAMKHDRRGSLAILRRIHPLPPTLVQEMTERP
ncbi:hypothetical protein E5CHR_01400 [Variovorax sp. PBL-E5]|nr:hypothetical protein E5CHR_01400 [Variovorax sp. PBL-E5]